MLRRLLGNASSNLLQLFVNMIVTFIMAPIYLRMMGHYDYGLRELIMALAGYMGLLSLGMQPTVSRFISMHNARNERRDVLAVYSSSFVFMCLVGLVLASVFWLWATTFPHTLGEDSGSEQKYQTFLMIVGFQLLVIFPMYVTQSILMGLQKFYVKNLVTVVFTVIVAVISYFYMTEDNALVLLVSLTTIAVVLKFIIFAAFLKLERVGGWSLRFSYFSRSKLKEMIVFGAKSMVQAVAGKINNISDRMVIGGLLGPSAVPSFTIPETLMGYVNNITMTLTQVFMPFFSDLNAKGNAERLREIYLISSKYTVALVFAMSVGIIVVGPAFIQIWMPGEFDPEVVTAIITLLAVYIAIHRLNPFAGHFLTAINKHGFLAKVMPVGALLNLVLSIWLVSEIGILGAAIGTLIPTLILVPMILIYSCRHLGVSVWQYITESIFPALKPVLVMTGILLWVRSEWGLVSYLDLLVVVAAGAVSFTTIFWFFSCSKRERDFWLGQLKSKAL